MKTILTLIMALSAGLVNAQQVDNWTNSSGQPWKSGTGLCWRNASWTPATAHPDCDGAVKPLEKVTVRVTATLPAPAPVTRVETPRVEAAKPVAVRVSYATDTLFDFDKSVIKAEGKIKLNDLVVKLKAINVEVVIVVGHTDWIGTDTYNMKLGSRRAESVKAYLVSNGIEKGRIYTESKGERSPVADNKTKEGRAKNRRVEIEVVGTSK